MRALFVLAFLARAPAAASVGSHKAYDTGDIPALERYAATGDAAERREGFDGLADSIGGRPYSPELRARLDELARSGGKDPVVDVRHGAGSLSRALVEWERYSSPEAQVRRAKERWEAANVGRMLKAAYWALFLTITLGGLLVVVTQLAAAYLLVHSDFALDLEARTSAALFAARPALFTLPALSAVSVAVLAGAVFRAGWARGAALGSVGEAQLVHEAVSVVFGPMLAGCAAAFLFGLLLNAVYLDFHVRRGRGQPADPVGAVARALKALPTLLVLGGTVFVGLAAVERLKWWSIERDLATGRRSSASSLARSLGGLAAESGALLALHVALCAALFEGKGPLDAASRAAEILKPGWRSAAKAAAATGLVRGDVFGAALLSPILGTFFALMLGMLYQPAWLTLARGAGIFALSVLAALAMADFILTFASLLDAVFGAALYLHVADGAPAPRALATVAVPV